MALPEVRRQRLLELVRQRKSITTTDLVAALGASSATVRRDMAALEDLNLLKRTHGGVVCVSPEREATEQSTADYEPAFQEKVGQGRVAKDAIAQAAATLVEDGSTILLDSGTTSLALAKRLAGRRITVVALDLKVAEAAAHSQTEVLIAGGRVRPGLFSVVGPWTDAVLESLMVDTFFMGADAIAKQGLTNSAIDEARVKSLAMRSAKQCVVMADHSKFNHRKMAPVCGLHQIDVLVTDEPTRALIADYAQAFARVIYA
ncbi:MAG: DeoR/GlpR transcriptional regulator [Ideonella sp. MAG2]|nr:MAG: DeoR/GlpR transcriptional regulator [Ideonella sp. MAG2]